MPNNFILIIVLSHMAIVDIAQGFTSYSCTSNLDSSCIRRLGRPVRPRKMTEFVDCDHNQRTPIISSALTFTEDDNEEVNARRSATFDRFSSIVKQISEMDDDNQISLIWLGDREVNHSGVVPINSLLFEVSRSNESKRNEKSNARTTTKTKTVTVTTNKSESIVVVVPSSSRVNVQKLQNHLEEENHDERIPNTTVRCALVPAYRVEAVCGFPPGSVPPLGHIPHTLRILVDESLLRSDLILIGGGGHPKIGTLISSHTLLKMQGTELANVVVDKGRSSPVEHANAEEANNNNNNCDELVNTERRSLAPISNEFVWTRYKPYFPVAPPTLEEAREVLNHSDRPNPLRPVPLTFVGRLNGIRRMARRLVFCDIAPPDYVGTGTKVDSFDLTWKSAMDHEDMACQLIAGKTFCKHRGDGAEDDLKSLKVGQLVLVRGKTNVGNRESVRHWVDKRSLDIVVFDFCLLNEQGESSLLPSASALPSLSASTSASASRPTIVAQKNNNQNPPHVGQGPTPNIQRPTRAPRYKVLELSDVFLDKSLDSVVKVVDSEATLLDFQQSLHSLLSSSSSSLDVIKTTVTTPPPLVGIDCEWKPTFRLDSTTTTTSTSTTSTTSTSPSTIRKKKKTKESQPVLLLQISLQSLQKVFLFDLQSLLRPCLEPSEPLHLPLEDLTSRVLTELFDCAAIVKVGFQMVTDLQRLAGSYPHVRAFRSFQSVCEVGSVAEGVFLSSGGQPQPQQQQQQQQRRRTHTRSLAQLTEYVLEKSMDKEPQTSDWSQRPLTEAQLRYASLDAAVTPVILETLLEWAPPARWEWSNEAEKDYLGKDYSTTKTNGRLILVGDRGGEDDQWFGNAVSSIEFTFLEENTNSNHESMSLVSMKKLKAQKVVSNHWMAMQRWTRKAQEGQLLSSMS